MEELEETRKKVEKFLQGLKQEMKDIHQKREKSFKKYQKSLSETKTIREQIELIKISMEEEKALSERECRNVKKFVDYGNVMRPLEADLLKLVDEIKQVKKRKDLSKEEKESIEKEFGTYLMREYVEKINDFLRGEQANGSS